VRECVCVFVCVHVTTYSTDPIHTHTVCVCVCVRLCVCVYACTHINTLCVRACIGHLGIEVVEPVVAMDIGVQQQFQRVENAHADLHVEKRSLQS
jgi:hypothetical protein